MDGIDGAMLFQDKFLEDQKASMVQIGLERTRLAEEKAEFYATSRLKADQQQRDAFKTTQVAVSAYLHIYGQLLVALKLSVKIGKQSEEFPA